MMVDETSRWAQLTFSSFDDGVNPGGWQVKQTTGDPSDAEAAMLRSSIITQFDLTKPLPTFPTPEDIANLPRRLLYAPDGNGAAAYWHTCFAGADASGRPGNVFAHTVLDRYIGRASPMLRPIDLWRSSDWLVPYGADAVRHAVLGQAARPSAGSAVTLQTVIDFVLDPAEWRTGTLVALVDAVAAAFSGSMRVVLVVDSPDEAAMWIGAVSRCVSPMAARQLAFSTYQRAHDLPSMWARDLHLAAVPRDDLPTLTPDDAVIVIDSQGSVTMGELDGNPHTTELGYQVPVTPLSVLVESAFQDDLTAKLVLPRIDVIAGEVGDDAANLAWPLAAALAQDLSQFPDVDAVVDAVLISNLPSGLHRSVQWERVVEQRVLASIGSSAAEAWEALRKVERSMRALALSAYVAVAGRDRAWLAVPEGAPLPPRDELVSTHDERLTRAISELLESELDALVAPEQCLHILRLLDFVWRAGVDVGSADDPARETVVKLIRRSIVPVLLGPEGTQVAATISPPASGMLRATIRAAVEEVVLQRPARTLLDAGMTVAPSVLAWLYPFGVEVESIEALERARRDRKVSALTTAYIVHAETSGRSDRADSRTRAAAALWGALDAERMLGPGSCEDLVGSLCKGAIPRGGDMAELLRLFGTAVPARYVFESLCDDWSHETARLAAAVLRIDDDSNGRWSIDPMAGHVRDLADVRTSAHHSAGGALTRRNNLAAIGAVARLSDVNMPAAVVDEIAPYFVSAMTLLVFLDLEQEIDSANKTASRTRATQYGIYGTAAQSWNPYVRNTRDDVKRPLPYAINQSHWDLASALTSRVSVNPVVAAVVGAIKAHSFYADVVLAAAIMTRPDFPYPHWALAQASLRLAELRTSSGNGLLHGLIVQLVFRKILVFENDEIRVLARNVARAATRDDWVSDDGDDEDEILDKFFRKAWKEISSPDASRGRRSR